ncbi:MAG: hypothetical protein PUD72_07690 [Oscillospiraceae bacterium]|nr:hypothetical protein [Oscillospiraceae bacterium]
MGQKNYPFVFIHGMLGFGEDELIYNYMPYWGMLSGSIVDMLRAEGKEAYAPTISSLGSAWDRACEIYAQIVGGTVDYGKAHSEKYGHERYGRTYEKALIPDWGKLDAGGRLNKLHILGHSFGGATVRMFSQLLAYGSPEERAVTDKNDLSPFFEGGHGDWVKSVTTIAGPHNGTTVITAIGPLLPILKGITFFGFAGIMDNTPANKIYDMCLDQWGITSNPKDGYSLTKMLRIDKIIKAMRSKDNLYYDLSLAGARDLNEVFEANKDTYLFSISTSNSMLTANGNHRMKASSFVPFWLTGNLLGKAKYDKSIGEELDDSWLESDGASNTASALHPCDEPFEYFYDNHCVAKKGIWNVMPVYQGDHMDVVGGSLRAAITPYYINNYYKKFLSILENLPE